MRSAPIALLAFALACRFPNADQHFGLDADGDGTSTEDDCDDNDASVHPGADETCNETDDDCNGDVDDDAIDATTFHADDDDDGFAPDDGATASACEAPEGFVEVTGDCDDADDTRFPGNPEIAGDGIDQDCNEADTITCFTDADKDGWGVATSVLAPDGSCDTADGESPQSGDCDDGNDTRFPGAEEVVGDAIDQNCDGFDTPPCYHDDDDDSFGDPLDPIGTVDCNGAGGVTTGTDCNDGDDTVYPDAAEICDGQVNDCGGSLPATETDPDSDDWVQCTVVGSWKGDPDIDGGGDCSPSDGTIFPGAPALCDGKINACGTTLPVNEVDDDQDTFVECTFASGVNASNWANVETPAVTGGGDCNDTPGTGAGFYPGAPELCDGFVNACGGSLPVNEVDNDNDTYVECTWSGGTTPGNWGNVETPAVVGGSDCDDAVLARHPNADELCNNVDEDCDNVSDATDTDAARTISFEPDDTGDPWLDLTPANLAIRNGITFDVDGTLWLCPGSHFVRIDIDTAHAEVIGRYGRDVTFLSGATQATPTVAVDRMIDVVAGAGTDGIVIADLTLRRGLGTTGTTEGGAARIEAAGEVTIDTCTFEDNSAQWGGAIDFISGDVEVIASRFDRNTATTDGGAIYIDVGPTTFTDVIFDTNHADDDGGAIYVLAGTNTFNTTTFDTNDADDKAGAIYLTTGTSTFNTATFDTNDAADDGGALYIAGGSSTFNTSTFEGNNGDDDGGAVDIIAGTHVFSGSTFDTNTSDPETGTGGAMYVTAGTTTITNTTFVDNSADIAGALNVESGAIILFTGTTNSMTGNIGFSEGGAIESDGAAITMTGMNASGNEAPFGGFAFIVSGTFTTTGTNLIHQNTADTRGGAFRLFNGTLTLGSGTTLDDNTSNGAHLTSGNGGGGAVSVRGGTLNINGAQLINNDAAFGDGGAILTDNMPATVTITASSLLSGNTAETFGGAISCMSDCTVSLTNSSITNNTAAEAGGVMLAHAGATFVCAADQAGGSAITGNSGTASVSEASGVSVGDAAQINQNSSPANQTMITSAANCDWGANVVPQTLDIGLTGSTKSYTTGVPFTCDHDLCSP